MISQKECKSVEARDSPSILTWRSSSWVAQKLWRGCFAHSVSQWSSSAQGHSWLNIEFKVKVKVKKQTINYGQKSESCIWKDILRDPRATTPVGRRAKRTECTISWDFPARRSPTAAAGKETINFRKITTGSKAGQSFRKAWKIQESWKIDQLLFKTFLKPGYQTQNPKMSNRCSLVQTMGQCGRQL